MAIQETQPDAHLGAAHVYALYVSERLAVDHAAGGPHVAVQHLDVDRRAVRQHERREPRGVGADRRQARRPDQRVCGRAARRERIRGGPEGGRGDQPVADHAVHGLDAVHRDAHESL